MPYEILHDMLTLLTTHFNVVLFPEFQLIAGRFLCLQYPGSLEQNAVCGEWKKLFNIIEVMFPIFEIVSLLAINIFYSELLEQHFQILQIDKRR